MKVCQVLFPLRLSTGKYFEEQLIMFNKSLDIPEVSQNNYKVKINPTISERKHDK